MKHFIDGDHVVVTRDSFVDLQESPAVFIPINSDDGQTIIEHGVKALPIAKLVKIRNELICSMTPLAALKEVSNQLAAWSMDGLLTSLPIGELEYLENIIETVILKHDPQWPDDHLYPRPTSSQLKALGIKLPIVEPDGDTKLVDYTDLEDVNLVNDDGEVITRAD